MDAYADLDSGPYGHSDTAAAHSPPGADGYAHSYVNADT